MNKIVNLHWILLVVLLCGTTDVLCTNCREDWDEMTGIRNLVCKALEDKDFPLPISNGQFFQTEIVLSFMTKIPSNAFGMAGTTSSYIMIDYNQQLEHIESGFLGASPSVKNLQIIASPKLRDFPWEDLHSMKNLEVFKISTTGLIAIPSTVLWPGTIASIEFAYNDDLMSVGDHAFFNAINLKEVSFLRAPGQLTFEENALFTMADSPNFRLTTYDTPPNNHVMFSNNAFGNEKGGFLWGTLNILAFEFREQTFRQMLKSAFDMNLDHLFQTELGPIQLHNCTADCSNAWLYEDAQNYGVDRYLKLVGQTNVICPHYGPLLESSDEYLINHFKKCIVNP